MIGLNQLGYRPNDVKKAVVPPCTAGFSVIDLYDNSEVFIGSPSEAVYCPASDEEVKIADFSAVTKAGNYKLQTERESSFDFIIDNEPYKGLRRGLLEFYHYQKCGVKLDCGLWSHSACHTSPAFVINKNGQKTGETKDVSGGWHDAGDYGRYIVPAVQTVAQLLLAYELSDKPDEDLLDEVWFEIRWMLKMQDNATGAVYHKVSCRGFNPLDEMPDKELDELVLSPVSAEATADFAACTALASRFYPEHGEKLLTAAIKAWNRCVSNPEPEGFKNPPDVTTGAYENADIKSKYFWAACELFRATGDEIYHNYIKTAEITASIHWKESGGFGIFAYLQAENTEPELKLRMKEALLLQARELLNKSKESPYGISLDTDFKWGSNGDTGNNAMILLLAELFDKSNPEYREYALEHVNYLLGKNPLGQSYVSGFGSNPMKNPHHRPSVAVGQAVPGMVSGGPNAKTEIEPTLYRHCAGQPPMKCFTDRAESFSSNEVTIYWNSPFYFILAVLGL